MAREQPQVNIRLPPELKAALDEAATLNRRSLTAEIVARLEASFKGLPTGIEERIRELIQEERRK